MDDGSPDNSGAICNEYAAKDTRFKVIHKENGGVSSARQTGLNVVSGDYVIHVDPDDWVDKDMLAELHKEAIKNDYDVVIFNILREFKDRKEVLRQEPSKLDSKTILCELLEHKLHGSCVNKLVRRESIRKSSACFPENITCWEDLYFNCLLFSIPLKVSFIDKSFYHYDCYSSDNSIVRRPSVSRVQSQINFCIAMNEILNKEYHPLLYLSKAKTKLLIFRWRFFDKWNIAEIFADINDEFCEKNRFRFFDTEAFSVCLIIKWGVNPIKWMKLYPWYSKFANLTYAVLYKLRLV